MAKKVENSSLVLLSRFSAIRQESTLKTTTSHIRKPLAYILQNALKKMRQLTKSNKYRLIKC